MPVGDGQTLASFLAVPKDGRAITSWTNLDEAFDDAAGAIRRLLLKQSNEHPTSALSPDDPGRSERKNIGPSPPGTTGSSGSGFALKPRVTDRDRDRHLKDTFELTAATFQNRLNELSSDPRIEGEFERVDSRTFIAMVYVDGDKIGECRVFSGSEHFRNSLCLSFDAHSTNSMNEWLSLDSADGDLGFKPSGMRFGGGSELCGSRLGDPTQFPPDHPVHPRAPRPVLSLSKGRGGRGLLPRRAQLRAAVAGRASGNNASRPRPTETVAMLTMGRTPLRGRFS